MGILSKPLSQFCKMCLFCGARPCRGHQNMELDDARRQKTLAAEKQMAMVRAIVIVFGTAAFFLLDGTYIRRTMALWLIPPIWLYGAFILFFKPYEKYPIFLASWFSYTSDCIFATL